MTLLAFRLPPAWMTPYPFQQEALAALQRGIRKFLLIWPRRTGKDLTSLILGSMAYHSGLVGPGSMIYLFPEKEQGGRAIWSARPSSAIEVGESGRYIDVFAKRTWIDERAMRLKFQYPAVPNRPESLWGQECLFEIHDADPNSMVGGNQNCIICSEYGLPKMSGFLDYVRPILKENNGVLILNGTVRGRNHMYHLYEKVKNRPDWHVSYLTDKTALDWNGNRLVTEEYIQSEIEQGMDAALARQEYGNEWDTPSAGSFYQEQMRLIAERGQIGTVPYNPYKPVYTGWDLGLVDPTVIWFFQPNDHGGLNFIDYEAGVGKSFSYWLSQLNKGHRSQYVYDGHFVPHDAMQTRDGGAEHNPYRRIDMAYSFGGAWYVVKSAPGAVKEGIAQVANALPTCFFDERTCQNGLDALRHYRSRETQFYDAFGRPIYDAKPYHDENSDPADAIRTAIVGYNRFVRPSAQSSKGKKRFSI